MSTLRVLLNAPPTTARDDAWALFDQREQVLSSGRGTTASWPEADRREAVLAASAVRLIALRLPPMSAERIPAAAAFALEDMLAGPAHEQHLGMTAQQSDGTVVVAVAARDLIALLHGEFARVVAETAIAPVPPAAHWRWYASAEEGAFVRRPDGSAFATTAPQSTLPSELVLTLAHAQRTGGAPATIEVAFAVDEALLISWSAQSGVAFIRVTPWRWDQDGQAIAATSDLLQGEFSREIRVAPRSFAGGLQWTLAIAGVAVVLHVAATLVHWATLRAGEWQTTRAIIAAATSVGVNEVTTADSAVTAIAREYGNVRHRAGLAAATDAFPMLSRAAPAIAALAPGALKTAAYTEGQWTLELAKLDAATLSRLEQRLASNGLATIAAATAAGTRMRITLAPGANAP